MQQNTTALLSPSMLDTLIARWSTLPAGTHNQRAQADVERVAQARAILMKAVGCYLMHLPAADQALYARLLSARSPGAWRDQFFDCFDLMTRTCGITIAVLRLHDLHRLLLEDQPR